MDVSEEIRRAARSRAGGRLLSRFRGHEKRRGSLRAFFVPTAVSYLTEKSLLLTALPSSMISTL
jgi:hypothetical protein